jgi:uncharacterized integral membrane protein
MKIKLPPILDYGFRVIVIILLIFLSIEIDNFSFGMMNATSTVQFGLGVSLLLGGNLIIGMVCYDLVNSILNFKNKKNESNN